MNVRSTPSRSIGTKPFNHPSCKSWIHQTEATCLFRNGTDGTDFALVVDDFGVNYLNKLSAQHLIDTLQKLYVITIDWMVSKYLGFSITFDYEQHTVDISIPGYIDRVLQRFITCLVHITIIQKPRSTANIRQ